MLVIFLLYMYGCFACTYIYAQHACSAHNGQKRAQDPQELFTDNC